MQIYITRNGSQLGPFTQDELAASIKKGLIGSNELAWYDGCPAWAAISVLFPALVGSTSNQLPPPPPPPSVIPSAQPAISADHSLVWVNAFVPLMGLVTDTILKELELTTWIGTVIVIATNVFLTSKDEKQLKAQGFATGRLGSAWFVPVYLFKRVQVAGGGYGYAVTWLITFFVSLAW